MHSIPAGDPLLPLCVWTMADAVPGRGDDLGIYFVATEESHRRRGLGSELLLALMAGARDSGMRTATPQASADGLGVYERLGFRRVGDMRGYPRHPPTEE